MDTQTDGRIDRRADGRIDVGKLSIEVVLSIKICFRPQPLKIFWRLLHGTIINFSGLEEKSMEMFGNGLMEQGKKGWRH